MDIFDRNTNQPHLILPLCFISGLSPYLGHAPRPPHTGSRDSSIAPLTDTNPPKSSQIRIPPKRKNDSFPPLLSTLTSPTLSLSGQASKSKEKLPGPQLSVPSCLELSLACAFLSTLGTWSFLAFSLWRRHPLSIYCIYITTPVSFM